MRGNELLRLVWINIIQNKTKAIMTSIGIIVGAATIVMVIAIGKGGKMEVADQFKNLNAGAIDISYETAEDESSSSGSTTVVGGNMGNMGGRGNWMMGETAPGGEAPSQSGSSSGASGNQTGGEIPSNEQTGGGMPYGDPSGGEMPSGEDAGNSRSEAFQKGGMNFSKTFGNSTDMSDRINQDKITLSDDDVEDIETFVPGISEVTISCSSKNSVEGGDLEEETTYTIAGVKYNYAKLSNLTLAAGSFIEAEDDENKEKICILGSSAAEEMFGSAIDAYGSVIYIDGRTYVVNGVLNKMGTVSSGISPDEAVFIPYETSVKYITGTNVSPTITVIAEDIEQIDTVIDHLETVLAESYPNAEFTYNDAGSKMQAASASNDILTMVLTGMAVIVFIVGGIGIMNVLFVSVKERTNEIGILKAIGCSQRNILLEFLFEAALISLIGGFIGVIISVGITPFVERFDIRVELSLQAFALALAFAILTGTLFGFYPAWKASRLVPVDALNAE